MSGSASLAPEEAAAFDRRVFGNAAWSLETWRTTLSAAHRHVLTTRTDTGDLVALAVVALAPPTADLERIAVAEGHRRVGAGSALLRRVLDVAEEAGCSRLLLEVAADNTAALGLYRGAGGRVLSTRRGYYGDGADALVLAVEQDHPQAGAANALGQQGGERHGGQ